MILFPGPVPCPYLSLTHTVRAIADFTPETPDRKAALATGIIKTFD
jgi:hypothetical protein